MKIDDNDHSFDTSDLWYLDELEASFVNRADAEVAIGESKFRPWPKTKEGKNDVVSLNVLMESDDLQPPPGEWQGQGVAQNRFIPNHSNTSESEIWPKTKKEEQLDVTSMNFVDERRPLDVLCGRGSRSNNNKGNQLYLQAKNEMQKRYKQASKKEKTEMSRELISKVESWGGRFIDLYSDPKNCDGLECWYEVSSKVKLKKVSQALRDINTPQARKEKRVKYNKKK